MMEFKFEASFAADLDKKDALSSFRDKFFFPSDQEGNPFTYFTGNSLGLQPRAIKDSLDRELTKWANQAVEGHFLEPNPWMYYHKFTKSSLAKLVGAKPEEVVSMNNLTVNLHLLMVSFYRPEGKRNKIIMEAGAFPSDQYAVESHVRTRGLKPDDVIVEVKPDSEQDHYISIDRILRTIEETGEETALVMFSGVQYYSGQFFDIARITEAGHAVGAMVGFDLAHAVGNLPMNLHDDDVDFATWCSYKYLNSGPGNVSGIFIHEKHAENSEIPRFAGWWGHDEDERFQMKKGFIPMYGADGWQLSNVNVLGTAAHWESLKLFDEAGIAELRKKSMLLTSYLEFVINQVKPSWLKIITPESPEERGCQLSLFFEKFGREVFNYLEENQVIVDWREPNVVRLAPVPLYNSFSDIYQFGKLLQKSIEILDNDYEKV